MKKMICAVLILVALCGCSLNHLGDNTNTTKLKVEEVDGSVPSNDISIADEKREQNNGDKIDIPQSVLNLQELRTNIPISSILPGRAEIHWLYGHKLENGPIFYLLKTDGKEILGEMQHDIYVDNISCDSKYIYLSSWKNHDNGSSIIIILFSAEDLSLIGNWEIQSEHAQAQMVFSAVEQGYFLQHCDAETKLYHVDENGVEEIKSFKGDYCYGSVAPSMDKILLYDYVDEWEAPLSRIEPWTVRVLDFEGDLLFEFGIDPKQSYLWSDDGEYIAIYSGSENFPQTQTIISANTGEKLYPAGNNSKYRVESIPLSIEDGNIFWYRYCAHTGSIFY